MVTTTGNEKSVLKGRPWCVGVSVCVYVCVCTLRKVREKDSGGGVQ